MTRCPDCSWAGSAEELEISADGYELLCPICSRALLAFQEVAA